MAPWSMFQMAIFQLKWLHGFSQMPVSNADIMSYKKYSKHSEFNLYCVPSHFSLLATQNHTFCSSGNLLFFLYALGICEVHPVQKFHTTMSTFPACRALGQFVVAVSMMVNTKPKYAFAVINNNLIIYKDSSCHIFWGLWEHLYHVPYLGLY